MHPWGYGDAMLATLISNLARGKDDPVKKLADFMPADSEEPEVEDPWDAFKRLTSG